MCEKSEERTYYVRTILMYKDLTREVLFKLFKYLIKSEDIQGFLSSPEQQKKLRTLSKGKAPIINNTEYNRVSQHVNLKRFDISLLLKLILNLCEDKIPKPCQGWGVKKPDSKDETLGADLIRLRDIRNKYIGHRADTKLPKTEYESTWTNITSILLRVVELVDSKSRDVFKQSIKEYERLQVETVHRLWDEWIQEKVEEWISTSKEFQVYYKGTFARFIRYIKLLFHGGRIVLGGILKTKLGDQDLSDVLERNMERLTRGNIGHKCSGCLYSKGSCSDYKNWDVSLLANVLLFECKDDLEKKEIKKIENIKSLRENYATLASQSLDEDEYVTNWTDLIMCLNKLSAKIPKGDKQQIKNLIECYKKKGKEEGSDANDYIKQLRKFGVEDEVYNETLTELRNMLNQLSQERIKFQQEHILKFKLLATCEREETIEIVNDLLKKYLRVSSQQSDEPSSQLRNEINELMASMSAVPDVTPVQVKRKRNNQPPE